jgi:large subunit ribosomal protein L22
MAHEKDKQPKDETPKPRTRRSTAAKKTAAKPKPKAKPKAKETDKDAKPARPRRRTTTAKPKQEEAPKAETAPAEPTEEKADEKPATKAPARRRRATPKRDAPRKPAAAPVVTARAKYVRTSARKARLVIDHVRGKPIAEAQAVLRHSPRGVARDLERLLKSAVANAENNHDLVGDDLYIKEFYADEGPTLKRFRPRAQGRAYRIRKRTSHLTVALTPKE